MFKIKVVWYWLNFTFHTKFKNREALTLFQDRKVEKFRSKVLPKSKFYNQFLNNKAEFPIISKTEFMENFDSINTVGIYKEEAIESAIQAEKSRDFKSEIKNTTIGLSSGTSGKRGVFLASQNEKAKWVALVMSRVIKPKLFKKQKIAFFLRANSNLYSSIESSLFEFKYFDIFKPITEILTEINEFQPAIIAAQPSILLEIAEAKKLSKIDIKPNQIISFAEVLFENDKNQIQQTFDCKFSEVYQCTEGFLGATCDFGTMHLNEDFMRFEKEWIDSEHFYPIITDFTRQSQPIVNYRLDDVLKISKNQCKCGSKLQAIEQIIGRNDDILIFKSKQKLIKIFPDLIARRIALVTDSFIKYQIKQMDYFLIEISIESENYNEVKNVFENAISILLEENGIQNVKFKHQNFVNFEQGNKFRKIQKAFT